MDPPTATICDSLLQSVSRILWPLGEHPQPDQGVHVLPSLLDAEGLLLPTLKQIRPDLPMGKHQPDQTGAASA